VKINVNKDSDVPIRDQLIEQIGLQIASGSLKGNEKLPSIRALAQRLGIHYSTVTAAYNHLADTGLLEVRQGSGVRVAGRPPSEGNQTVSSLDELLRDFLAKVCGGGTSRDDLRKRLQVVMNPKPVRRIVAVDRNKDFHPLLLRELKPQFALPVETMTVEEILQNRSVVEDALVVTSLYHLFAFEDAIADPTRLVVCNIEPASSEFGFMATMPPGSLVALISGSHTLMNMATKLCASLRTDIGVRSVLVSDRNEVDYLMKHADLILCDSSSEDVVVPLAGKKKVLVFKLYSSSTIQLVKERLAKWG
jgi:DNA-binding transcriptional regulator YhcF (GntR family)